MNFDFEFDFSSLDFKKPEDEDCREIPKLSYEPVMFDNAVKMADKITWGKDYIALTAGSFVFGDFLEALCLKKSIMPDVIYITTLGMNENNIDSLVNIVEYLGCKKINLIISHYFAGVERHNLIPYMEQEFKGKPINVAVLRSHMKTCVIKSSKGNAVLLGSANLSSSNNVECFQIIFSEDAVDFMEKRLNNIMQRFTVLKGLDGAKMNWKANHNNTGTKAFNALKET